MKYPGQFIEMINILEDVRGLGERDWGDCLLNMWFPFGVTKKISGTREWRWLQNIVNVLYAT